MSQPFGPEHHRIGNQQREEAINALNDHFAAGRVDISEYENRVTRATTAQTYQELADLFSDLPHPHPPFLAPPTPPPFPTMTMAPPPPPPYTPAPGFATPPPPPPPPGYGTTGYGATGYGANVYAPYGYDPLTGMPLSDKSKVVAGILQLFLGHFGVGRFYMGDTGIAVAQLLTCGGCGIWALVDAIIILVNGGTDAQGRKLRD
ncbi:NINE protein [Lentzea sp. NBRC 105346]|uniref:NINE protein n=1 Tax=Lentzea sp. NBRC 105346 TaxID=3032205 RepID=UPI002555D2A2|nr:NINE protein [Lentzea sp. NBRC 105346]